ncbi:MAG: hypothetical protein JST80_08410 [Bdellovibrionales bacterium]|nr:hypothetical protein [Bdellovibrionales bacterium]
MREILRSLMPVVGCLAATIAWAEPRSCENIYTAQATESAAAGAAHDTIDYDLFTGRVVSVTPFKENDNRNFLFLIRIESRSPFTGKIRVRDAFFKPFLWGDSGGYARAGMEYAAYAFNRLLKMDYVPPTAYRYDMSIESNGIRFTQGAVIFKVPEFTPMANLSGEVFNESDADYHDAVISDHRVLAVLLQNGDGHRCNLGQGKHWTDGGIRPVFIDWGASLRRNTGASMTTYGAWGNNKPVTRIRAQTYGALKGLRIEDVERAIGDFVNNGEIQGIMDRRDSIVAYFESLIALNGREAVIIDF